MNERDGSPQRLKKDATIRSSPPLLLVCRGGSCVTGGEVRLSIRRSNVE